ncbi:hypothetical protein NDU88_002505 [Pleurodeles waltl]|uniref:Uncharacterized protein n=1 Tax=Pleurodeles waltl TaxID=8319 RepID=A0AAV7MB72_PLEWA|nr:hypothetical protein NDU88_002505 [Pleurodeles waltl]
MIMSGLKSMKMKAHEEQARMRTYSSSWKVTPLLSSRAELLLKPLPGNRRQVCAEREMKDALAWKPDASRSHAVLARKIPRIGNYTKNPGAGLK